MPASPATLRVGVEVPCRLDDAGEYLADARALEAAGSDSIWVDRAADAAGHDPWMLLAAIAAVTDRVRLALPLRAADVCDSAVLTQRLATLERVSRGRIMITLDGAADARGHVADLARRVGRFPILVEAGDEIATTPARPDERDAAPERWARVAIPDTRDAWRATLHTSREAGVTGVIVPFGPRLLDLLRRPDEEDDRSDLLVAQG